MATVATKRIGLKILEEPNHDSVNPPLIIFFYFKLKFPCQIQLAWKTLLLVVLEKERFETNYSFYLCLFIWSAGLVNIRKHQTSKSACGTSNYSHNLTCIRVKRMINNAISLTLSATTPWRIWVPPRGASGAPPVKGLEGATF